MFDNKKPPQGEVLVSLKINLKIIVSLQDPLFHLNAYALFGMKSF